MPASLASRPVAAFPVDQAGRLPHYLFRGLHSVHNLAACMGAEPPEAARCIEVLQTMSLPPPSAPTATGWSDSCRAGFAPAEDWRLARRTDRYKVATCTQARPVFCGSARQVHGKVIAVSILSVPWLKAAYLSVFSLLGVQGYKYAKGAAVEAVREQIMKQEDEIIPRFAAEAPMWKQRDGILVSRKTPGWVVKMGERIILLPRGWDRTFYERIGSRPADEIAVGDGPFWFPARFGANRRVRGLTVREGRKPLELLGEDTFGATGQGTQDGKTIPFVVVDCHGQEVTIMITAGLGGGDTRVGDRDGVINVGR